MPRIATVTTSEATPKAQVLLGAVEKKLGMIPNLIRTFGRSEATLEAYLNLSGALAGGKLSAQEREIVALAVAEANDCAYCLAAHSAIGKAVGLGREQILDARRGTLSDRRQEALATLARQITDSRGHLADEQLDAARRAGLHDEDILEVVGNVTLNILTNYTNHIAATVVDFPAAEPLEAIAAR
ncbi:MAG: peroxidase-related enzyme [Candidatus Sumerlaeia bacterium]|nr:peroxidase-related enzyme [Candidatus Sumerlaeia bacterium]